MHTLNDRVPKMLIVAALAASLALATAPTPAAAEEVALPPTVTSVSPRHGTVSGGTWVTIKGSDFTSDAKVLFADTPAAQVLLESSGQLRAYSPALSAGVHSIRVQTAAGVAPAGNFRVRTLEAEVLRLVNHHRAHQRKCGAKLYRRAKPLRWDATLAKVARAHSADMAQHSYFSHNSRNGTTPFQRMRRAGYRYRYAGENIAAGYVTPESVVNAWLRSPGHCRVLMSKRYRELGVGIAKGGYYGTYWTQDYGRPR